jgi:Holliday junction resolvase-like predicted endonuclease
MRLLGYEVEGEVHTDKGRIDVVLKKGNDIIVIEIKYGREEEAGNLVEEGLRQIREKKYYEKYIGSTPILLAIGFGKGREIGCRFERVS